MPLPDEPTATEFLGSPSLTASPDALAYFASQPQVTRFQWVDRADRSVQELPVPEGDFVNVVLSPDGSSAVVTRRTSADASDLWLLDLRRMSLSRFTHLPGRVDRPVWSPDGSRIAFSANRGGHWDIYEKAADGTGEETPLVTAGSTIKYPSAYSADGRTLIYEQLGVKTGWDLWTVALASDQVPQPLLATPYDELNASLSRDGRWLAFDSNESGRFEIHLLGYPGPGRRQMITTSGGSDARWRADGREIACLSGSNLAYIGVDPATGAATGPTGLRPLQNGIVFGDLDAQLARSLVIVRREGARATNDVTLLLNWRSELERR